MKPIRFAGTVRQYSKKAIPHENKITRISGHPLEIFISLSFKWPYHAKVINMFDATSIRTVQSPFTDNVFFSAAKVFYFYDIAYFCLIILLFVPLLSISRENARGCMLP